MSQNPSIEAKIAEELDSLGLLAKPGCPQPRALQYDDLSKLTYLNMVIKARTIPVQRAVCAMISDNLLKPLGKVVQSWVRLMPCAPSDWTASRQSYSNYGVSCIAFSDALVSAGG